MKKSILAIVSLGAAMATTPALAESKQVGFNDLNLASIEGQETLERRINHAARQVCGYSELKTGTRVATPAMRSCFAKAKKSATAQMAAAVNERRLGG